MILIKRPGDLVEGARCCRKVIIVSWTLIAVHGGEGIARRFEGVNLLVLQLGITETAESRRLGAVTPRKHVTGLLGGVIMPR